MKIRVRNNDNNFHAEERQNATTAQKMGQKYKTQMRQK